MATAAPAVPFLEDGLPHKKLVADAASVFRVCGETRVVDDSDRTSANLVLLTHFVSVEVSLVLFESFCPEFGSSCCVG